MPFENPIRRALIKMRDRAAEKNETRTAEQYPDLSARQRETLEKVDFGLVKQLYSERMRRSGVDPSSRDFITMDKVRQAKGADSLGVGGSWNPISRMMLLTEPGKDVPISRESYARTLTSVFFHEQAHALSRNFHAVEEDGRLHTRSGIADTHTPTIESEKTLLFPATYFLNTLNEGLTDSISEEVYYEYHRQKGLASVRSTDNPKELRHRYDDSYPLGRKLLQHFIEQIAQSPEMEDTVRKGFERAYFEGLRFDTPEMRALMDETITPEFSEYFMKMNSQKHPMFPTAAWKELILKPFVEGVREKWLHMLRLAE